MPTTDTNNWTFNLRRHRILLGACAVAILVVAGSILLLFGPSGVARGAVLGSSTISIDGGNLSDDWSTFSSPTTGLAVIQDGSDASPDAPSANSANDLNFFWVGMSTRAESGATEASASTPIDNFYYRIDINKSPSSGTKLNQKYNVQLNLGAAAAGKADHLIQVFAGIDGATEEVEVVLYEYNTPFPDIGAVTTGLLSTRCQVGQGPEVSPVSRMTPTRAERSEHTSTVVQQNMASK